MKTPQKMQKEIVELKIEIKFQFSINHSGLQQIKNEKSVNELEKDKQKFSNLGAERRVLG